MYTEPISFSFAFQPWSNIGTDKLVHYSQAHPYGIYTCINYLTQAHLHVKHHKQKQLFPFLKSLVWISLGWIRTLDLLNSKQTIYLYTIELVNHSMKKNSMFWYCFFQQRVYKSYFNAGLLGTRYLFILLWWL